MIYFSGSWCKPCISFGPIMESTGLPFQKVDVDASPEMASSYNVRSVPTVLILENGKEIKRVTGIQSKQTIMNLYHG